MTGLAPPIKILKNAIAKARTNPAWFYENILNLKTNELDKRRGQNWSLDPWQKELPEAVADIWRLHKGKKTKFNHKGLNKITIRAMHGPGKTFSVAALMHWFNFCFKGLIVCTGPKEKTLKTRLYPAFRKILHRSIYDYRQGIKVDSTKITWYNDEDWVAHIEAAANTENLAGYHEEFMLFIVDEASGVREEMFPAIEGAISTGTLVVLVMIGNPTKNIGTFYDSHRKERVSKNYYRMHVDLDKTTRVSKKWVKEMCEKYGPDSPIVAIRVKGDFADTDENQLISLEHIIAAKDREFIREGMVGKLRVSVDVADGGEDESIITVARHYNEQIHFIKQKRFSFPASRAPILTAKAAIELYKAHGGDPLRGDDIVIDAIGVGAGAAGYAMDAVDEETGNRLNIPVIPYKGGEASDDPKRWRNRRVQSYMAYNKAYEAGRIVISDEFLNDTDWEDFQAQNCSIMRNNASDRVEDLLTKKQMKDMGIKSPDMADSPAMQFATTVPILSATGKEHSSVSTAITASTASNYDEAY